MELREEICKYMDEKYGLKYDPHDEIVVTIGASEGIDIALRAIIEPGDEIMVVEPSYVSYIPCITMCGGVPVVLETKSENEFRLQPEEIESKITPKTKAIILPYPNNPTGAIMEKKDLEAIAEVIIKHELVGLRDDIYSELTYGQHHV